MKSWKRCQFSKTKQTGEVIEIVSAVRHPEHPLVIVCEKKEPKYHRYVLSHELTGGSMKKFGSLAEAKQAAEKVIPLFEWSSVKTYEEWMAVPYEKRKELAQALSRIPYAA